MVQVVGEAQVGSGFIVIKTRRLLEDTMEQLIRVNVKIEDEVWSYREPKQVVGPLSGQAPHRAPGNEGEDVSVSEHYVARLESRNDFVLELVREVSGVE